MFVPARKIILGLALAVSLCLAVAPAQATPSGGCVVAATTTCTFIYQTPNGAPEPWVVPAGVSSAVFDVYGAQGGNLVPPQSVSLPGGSGGKGGHVQATVTLTPGATLNIRVGGAGQNGGLIVGINLTLAGGFNGGGSNTTTCNSPTGACVLGGTGGGSSDVRTSGDALTDRLLVGGGGGGAGVGGDVPGNGGASATAANPVASCTGGGPGTLIAPGLAGGGVGCTGGLPGAAGGLTGGGSGGATYIGAGGGGLFGGGAGAFSVPLIPVGSGGGGGSDYPDPANLPNCINNPPCVTDMTVTDGVQSGNGLITVTYTTPTAVTLASANATRTSKGLLVHWRTGTETDVLGFHVYRSRGHSWQRLTRSLIAAKGSVSGASYRFLDRTARRGVAYRYRIKAVNRDGTAAWFGPVRVT